jgi:hypothetical protein
MRVGGVDLVEKKCEEKGEEGSFVCRAESFGLRQAGTSGPLDLGTLAEGEGLYFHPPPRCFFRPGR